MKQNRIFILLSFIMIVFSACEKSYTTDDLSKDFTTHVVYKYIGDQVVITPPGEPYTDPGVIATEAGVNVELDNVEVFGATTGYYGDVVNYEVPDKYTIVYTATNSDGYVRTAEKTVFVINFGDLTTNIEGLYKADVVRNGVVAPEYQGMEYIMIWKTAPNVYQISDAIGGYYAIGRAYGPAYAASGLTVTANNIAINDFTFGGPVGVGAFGGALTMNSMTVNPVNKTIKFQTFWDAGYLFDVTLTQVSL